MSKNQVAVDAAKVLLAAANPLAAVMTVAQKAITIVTEKDNQPDSKDAQLSLSQLEYLSKIHAIQAKVRQEEAIARRIDTAEEVIIEEFYDSSAEGNIGVGLNETNVSFGIGGSGKRVTKRIYKFKGWHANGEIPE